MRTSNLANEAIRQSEVGMVWEEKISGGTGSIEVLPMASFRVRATGATTVTIDGVLAMTMTSGEIAVFCAGNGNPDDTKPTVTITIGAAAAYVQVARDKDRSKLLP